MDEKETAKAQELTDEQLKKVAGGQKYFAGTDGNYYVYIGRTDADRGYTEDCDRRYLCPNCGRPVHLGVGARYYCDPCDESWFFESKLSLNINSGLYKQISKAEYERNKSWWE